MSKLPPNWALARVGDLVDLGPKNDCPDDTEVGFVPLQRLGVDYRSRHTFELKPWSAVKKGYTHFADGDVLLARITPSFENGKAGIVRSLPNGIGAGSTEYFVCRPIKGALLPEYLLAHFKTPQFLRDGEQVMSGAVGQQRVPKQYVLNSELRLAPFNEQKRIADKLDAVLARVDACRERLDRVPAILKRFRQAVLAAATSGKLTEEWREERRRSLETWATNAGHEVFPFITSGSRGWAAYYSDSGARFLRVGNLDHDTIELDLQDVQHVMPPQGAEGQRTRIQVGDILISITADVGMVGLVREDIGESYINQHLCLARQTGEYSGPYLAYFLASPMGGLAQLTEAQRGATKAGLTLGDIRELQIQMPRRDEQDQIVRCVEALFAYADRLETRYTAACAQVESLTPALLAKAFRGELVPQDSNDEPASILLERIRAARAASEGAAGPKRRKGGRPKTSQKAEVLMLTRKDIQDTHLTTILKERGPLTAEALWSASQLDIDDFYDQLKDEEARGLLREKRGHASNALRMLEAA